MFEALSRRPGAMFFGISGSAANGCLHRLPRRNFNHEGHEKHEERQRLIQIFVCFVAFVVKIGLGGSLNRAARGRTRASVRNRSSK